MMGFSVLFVVVFSVDYWMRGHLAVKAHNWANPTAPVVSQSPQREICGWWILIIIAWLSCDDIPSLVYVCACMYLCVHVCACVCVCVFGRGGSK